MALAHARRRILENVVVVWYDPNINQSSINGQHSINQIRQINSSVEIFTFIDDCVDYLNDIHNEKTILIVSGSFGQEIVPAIQDIPSLYAIYVLCSDPTMAQSSITEYSKVKGVFTEIEPLCVRLKRDLHQTDLDLTPISILPTSSPKDLNQLDQSFMYSQLLKEILMKMTNDNDDKKNFVQFCREQCSENESRLSVIEEFERDYDPILAIRWYTRDCFIYSMVNKALRTQEIDIILKMGFFIRDLHRQIERLYTDASRSNRLILFRGQGISNAEFEKLRKSKGGLLSFNSFLSTSFDEQVAFLYADSAQQNPSLTGVLFQIDIDPQMISTPFASLRELSYFEDTEGEILFSMHTIFRIHEINAVDNRLWKVELASTNDHDTDLKQLIDFIRREIGDETEWNQLVNLMLKMGEYNKAEEIHRATCHIDADDDVAGHNNMGMIMTKKGNKKLALSLYERALKIQEKSLPLHHLQIARLHNNIGEVRLSMGEYSTALHQFNKVLTLQQPLLPENHPELGRTYSHIGCTYWFTGEYSKSREYLEKGLVILRECLPCNHPDLGTAHNNIGEVYESLGNYQIALSHYAKALEIRQKTLPPNHPDLASSYNNIGDMHQVLGQWSSALTHFQRALTIQQTSLPSNHPDLATEHNNIGEAYRSMEKYAEALPHYKQALEIQEESLPLDHPDLAKMHNNIGLTYGSLKNYSAALSHYKKALQIQEKSLGPTHPDLATVHNNIGHAYQSMGDNVSALVQMNKTLEIQQESLPADHSDIGRTHNNIGVLHFLMGNSSKTILHAEKALEIWHKSFPSDHPYLKQLHLSLSGVYLMLQRHEDAMRHSLMGLGIIPAVSSSASPQPHISEEELD